MINKILFATVSKLKKAPFCNSMKLDSSHYLIQKESLCAKIWNKSWT